MHSSSNSIISLHRQLHQQKKDLCIFLGLLMVQCLHIWHMMNWWLIEWRKNSSFEEKKKWKNRQRWWNMIIKSECCFFFIFLIFGLAISSVSLILASNILSASEYISWTLDESEKGNNRLIRAFWTAFWIRHWCVAFSIHST